MTLDDTTLATALRDLAGTAPDNPARLAQVHRLARRRHHRQRALGAGALAATIAAGVAGVDALSSGGGGTAAGIHPASGGSAASAPAPVAPAGGLPACPVAPAAQPSNKPVAPPTVGQQFTGGGLLTAAGTATSVSVEVQGGPMTGSQLTLTIGPSSKVYLNDQAVTGAQLQKGLAVKFSATRIGDTAYLLDELRAGTPSAPAGVKQGAPNSVTAPAVGDGFKVAGQVTAATPSTLTVDVQGGSLPPGPYTFTLQCSPAGSLLGKLVAVAGTRTGTSTYEAAMVALEGS